MSAVARTGFIGLVTNVACTQAPQGALQEAENVVCRRAGALETRDGISLTETVTRPAWGFSLDDDNDVIGVWDATDFNWKLVGGAALQYTDPVLGAIDPQPFRRDMFSYARSRGNVYVPYNSGTLRLSSTAFETSGVPAAVSITGVSGAAGSWLANNESVSYRLVAVRRDDDGLVVSSAPCGVSIYTNSTGAPGGTAVSAMFVDTYYGLFDEVEVYRSRSNASVTTIDDEMQLAGVIPLSSFTLASGIYSVTYVDSTAQTSRGKTLYTSPSRGGILQQNDRPPAAAAIAAYKGSLFWGNTRGPFRKVFSFYWRGSISSATGVGSRAYTGDITNGSPTILNVSSTTGLERGMIVTGSIAAGAYVTNISGTTVTISQNATATAVGAGVTFHDAFKIDGAWIRVQNDAGAMVFDYATYGTGAQVVTRVFPAKSGYSYTFNAETFSRLGGTAPTIQATHGGEYDPPLPVYTATAEDYDQDVWPGGIMWSKADEPEHVTPVSYAFVGDKAKAILGLVPTRDALFVLKEDGIFRLTGANGVWRIDPYDPTTQCILPSSVQPLNGRAYFLSNKGVVAFGDGGAENLSLPVHDLVRDTIDLARATFLSTGFYEIGTVGSTAAVFPRENEYTIMRGTAAEYPLVWNENTRAWTTWRSSNNTIKSLFQFERSGRIGYAFTTSLYSTRLAADSQSGTQTREARNDGETAVTATFWNLSTSTVTLSGAVTAYADDVIQDADGNLWRVTADTTSASIVVDGPTGEFTIGACFLTRPIRCSVAPQTFYGDPMSGKCNESLTAMFSRLDGPVVLRYAYSSQLTPLANGSWTSVDATTNVDADGGAAYTRGYGYSQIVPNSHARSWLLDAAVRWVVSHGDARLEGVYLDTRVIPGRSNQQVAG